MKDRPTKPLISIAMATYNGEKYLKEQLDSIYAQTYQNIEVIVTDDCSTDTTVEILKRYSRTHGLKYYVNEYNVGLVRNFEKALLLCNGEYVALSDQDDIWEKDKLKLLYNKIGDKLLIHSDAIIIDEKNQVLQKFWKKEHGYNIQLENFFFGNEVTGCTVLMRKELLKISLPFPEGLIYHDWWLGICAAKYNKIGYTPECLIRYRKHCEQDTGMKLKTFFILKVWMRIFSRFQGLKNDRMIATNKHLQQMKAISKDGRYFVEGKEDLMNDVIIYLSSYLNNVVHIKTFFIGLKYHKIIYPQKNYFYIKNILFDIIG